jgi:hypothetical protein
MLNEEEVEAKQGHGCSPERSRMSSVTSEWQVMPASRLKPNAHPVSICPERLITA